MKNGFWDNKISNFCKSWFLKYILYRMLSLQSQIQNQKSLENKTWNQTWQNISFLVQGTQKVLRISSLNQWEHINIQAWTSKSLPEAPGSPRPPTRRRRACQITRLHENLASVYNSLLEESAILEHWAMARGRRQRAYPIRFAAHPVPGEQGVIGKRHHSLQNLNNWTGPALVRRPLPKVFQKSSDFATQFQHVFFHENYKIHEKWNQQGHFGKQNQRISWNVQCKEQHKNKLQTVCKSNAKNAGPAPFEQSMSFENVTYFDFCSICKKHMQHDPRMDPAMTQNSLKVLPEASPKRCQKCV